MDHAPFYARLRDRAVLAVSGADAAAFLQGLVSCDVRKSAEETAVLGALLSPQGKFLFDFFLLKRGDAFLLDTEAARAEELLKKLAMYRLRAAVEIALREDVGVIAAVGVDTPPPGAVADPRHPAMGWRLYGEDAPPDMREGSREAYETLRISLGLPDGSRDAEIGRTILLENGYDKLGGVDFAKGCYVGQEVTARSRHRGELRKYLFIVKGEAPLPEAGTELTAGGRGAGVMRSSCGGLGLALLHADRLGEGIPVLAAGRRVEIFPPWWHTAP